MYRGGDGNLVILSGADAVGQNCVTAVRAQKGEMQYALQDGMPTRQVAFDQYRPIQFEANFKRIVKAIPGVVRVTAFTIQNTKNVLQYAATIETIYGNTFIRDTLAQ